MTCSGLCITCTSVVCMVWTVYRCGKCRDLAASQEAMTAGVFCSQSCIPSSYEMRCILKTGQSLCPTCSTVGNLHVFSSGEGLWAVEYEDIRPCPIKSLFIFLSLRVRMLLTPDRNTSKRWSKPSCVKVLNMVRVKMFPFPKRA